MEIVQGRLGEIIARFNYHGSFGSVSSDEGGSAVRPSSQSLTVSNEQGEN